MAPLPRTLPVVPLLKEQILFPSLVLRVQVERKDVAQSISRMIYSGSPPHLVACVPQRPEAVAALTSNSKDISIDQLKDTLLDYGCMGKILRVERNNGAYVAIVEGLSRVRLEKVKRTTSSGSSSSNNRADSQLEAAVFHHDERGIDDDDEAAQKQLEALRDASVELVTTLKGLKLPAVLLRRLEGFIQKAEGDSAGQLCDLMVSVVEGSYVDKLAILKAVDVVSRLKLVYEIVTKQMTDVKVSRKISTAVDQNLNKQQKEFILRQKLNAIKKELSQATGEKDDEEEDDATELRKRIDAAELSDEARTVAEKELRRLKRMQPQQAEYQVIRTYLDNLIEIPWKKQLQTQSLDKTNIDAARKQLDADHYGLEKVKKRLIEYLAILRLRQTLEQDDIKLASSKL
ncbi:hypothetical protein PYCC9005_003745 [Savitreella phatthalungensis]